MIQGDPLYSPLPAVSDWPGLPQAAQQGPQIREPEPSLSPGHLQPHGCSISVFSTLIISRALFSQLLPSSSLVLMQKNLEVEEDGLKFKIQGEIKNGDLTVSCQDFKNI